jgi:LysM repeat protein
MVNKYFFNSAIFLSLFVGITSTASGTHSDFFSGKDSIGTKIINGEKFIQHRINKGETLYSLNRKYTVPIELIKKYNPGKAERLVVGEILNIPTSFPKESKKDSEVTKADESVKKTEKATRGDIPVKNIPEDKINQERKDIQVAPEDKPEYLPESASMTNKVNGTGEPVWAVKLTGKIEVLTDPRIQQEPMYALHPNIPEGTLVKIINPVNEKFVIVKTLKPQESQILKKEVFLYISPIAARYLDIAADPEKMEMRFTLSSK